MDFINKFFEFIIDNNIRLPAKVLTILGVLFCLYLLNDALGFTYYYNIKNKVEQIKAISEILHDSTLSPEVKKQVSLFSLRVFRCKNIFERTFAYANTRYDILRTYFANRDNKAVVIITNKGDSIILSKTPLPRNDFLFLMTGAGIFVLLAVLIVPICLYLGLDQGLGTGVSAFIILVGGFGFISLILYLILSLVSVFKNTCIWNYMINIFFAVGNNFCLYCSYYESIQ